MSYEELVLEFVEESRFRYSGTMVKGVKFYLID